MGQCAHLGSEEEGQGSDQSCDQEGDTEILATAHPAAGEKMETSPQV